MERKLPGGPIPEHHLFEPKVHTVDGKSRIVGFTAPGGQYFALGEGEEVVFIYTGDGKNRKTFIRKEGEDIPFEDWKEGK